jgi:mannose-6-phosphate isomerase
MSARASIARAIAPRFVPKLWGSTELEPWFRNTAERIGEVWFPADDLLIKFLFTTEDLSVQVHPGDAYAAKHENSRGKTEMWHILRAVPGARVALGFRAAVGRDAVEAWSRSGEIMERLAWHEAHPGDTFFTPAGTVHAIGGGLALCEIQQNSDVTYRLYDYGRGRELHLERALEVADRGTHPGAATARVTGAGEEVLVECGQFVTEKLQFRGSRKLAGGGYAIVTEGNGRMDGQAFEPGTVWDLGRDAAHVETDGAAVLLVARAASPALG